MGKIYFVFFLFSCQLIFSQNSTSYRALSEEDKQKIIQLVKEKTFSAGYSLSFNITGNDLVSDETKMYKEIKKDKAYLNNLISILS